MGLKPLNIFYEEPDPDRWVKFDRYPRKLIRRIVRGAPVRGGQFMVYYNLIKGLQRISVPYRINDYKYLKDHPGEVACIIGKDQVLDKIKWENPIAFGSAIGINPITQPDILNQYPIKKIMVPGEWIKNFFAPYGSENVEIWPVGIDTELWKPANEPRKYDFLIYNKIRWHHEEVNAGLVEPLKQLLKKNRHTFTEIKYGYYKPADLKKKIEECRYALFLCEHETQGIAYQQILASGLPILAWDRGGYWQDPNWYPDKIKFQPVSSVPYWDQNCGIKFTGINDFEDRLKEFMDLASNNFFQPRNYILQNLTLEICAENYVKIISAINA